MGRWSRFSLRSLLIGLGLCSVIGGMYGRHLVSTRHDQLMARARATMQAGGCKYEEHVREGMRWLLVDKRFNRRMASAVSDAGDYAAIWTGRPGDADAAAELSKTFDRAPVVLFGVLWLRKGLALPGLQREGLTPPNLRCPDKLPAQCQNYLAYSFRR